MTKSKDAAVPRFARSGSLPDGQRFDVSAMGIETAYDRVYALNHHVLVGA